MLHSRLAGDVTINSFLQFTICLCLPLVLTQIFQKRFGIAPWDRWELPSQAVAVGAAIVLIALLGAPIRTPFIYFQF